MWGTNRIFQHLVLSLVALALFEATFGHNVFAQEWSPDGSEYFSLDPSKDNSNIRHLLSNYWPVGRQTMKGSDRLALSDGDLSDGHLSAKMEHLQPVLVHTSKSAHKSILSDPSLLITATVPPLLLTVLTFPLTLTLLFHIVRQLVMIQNSFNQGYSSSPGINNPRTSPENNNAVNKAETNLEMALDKFKPSQK